VEQKRQQTQEIPPTEEEQQEDLDFRHQNRRYYKIRSGLSSGTESSLLKYHCCDRFSLAVRVGSDSYRPNPYSNQHVGIEYCPLISISTMNDHGDPEATPRPFHPVRNADVADRTPYIPRRKSSVGGRFDSSCRDVSTVTAPDRPQNQPHGWPKRQYSVKQSRVSKEERSLSRPSPSKVASHSHVYSAVCVCQVCRVCWID